MVEEGLPYLDSLITVGLILLSAVVALEVSIAAPVMEVLAGAIGGNLFGLEFTEPLEYLSFLGLVSLMYLAGLEVDLKLMKNNFKKGSKIGIGSFVIPLVIITAFTYYLAPSLSGNFEASMVIGIILSITSLAIVYPILKESGFIETEVGQVILGSAAFAEVLAMLMLSYFFLELSFFTILVVLIFVISIFTLPDFSKFLLERYKDELPEVEVRFVLLLLLGISTLSRIADIEVAISAFFIGVVTSEVIKDYQDLEKKLRSLVFGFASPFFFFEIGLEMKPEFIIPNIGLIISLLVVSHVAKFLGTYLFTRGTIPTHSKYISHLFNMPLPLGLLGAVLAFNKGTFGTGTEGEAIYASLIVVILATSIISSYFVGRKRCGLDMTCDIF